MPANTYRVTVRATVEMWHTISVVLPDGLTEAEVDERIDEAVDAIDWADELAFGDVDTDIEGMAPGYTYAPPPEPQPERPPEDAWFEWEGRRWATDGNYLVRDDCPAFIRVKSSIGWAGPNGRYPQPDVDRIREAIGLMPVSVGPAPHVDLRAEPLVRAAADVRWGTLSSPVWLLDESGALMAIVMPVRAEMTDNKETCDVAELFARTREASDV